MPPPRRARLATIRHPVTGDPLDRALLLWFPGPATATGEDLAEFHLHGGRAVVRAVEQALGTIPGLRPATPGEFTRRAFAHGVIDLAEAEGLADLLSAETEAQRRAGLAQSGGALSRQVAEWQARLLILSARVEAMLDFADEDDVAREGFEITNINKEIDELLASWRQWLDRPTTERLRDGVTVAIAGPPNAGKSTLLNALAGRDAAIVSPLAGTTRDVIEVPLAIGGVAFRLADTAGLHGGTGDVIEAEGMARARAWADAADLLLWLGPADEAPAHPNRAIIAAQADRRRGQAEWAAAAAAADLAVSAQSGEGLGALADWLVAQARALLPREGEVALNARHHAALSKAAEALSGGDGLGPVANDPLLLAESLRSARLSIDSITGQSGTEAMLDALFGRFCIGK